MTALAIQPQVNVQPAAAQAAAQTTPPRTVKALGREYIVSGENPLTATPNAKSHWYTSKIIQSLAAIIFSAGIGAALTLPPVGLTLIVSGAIASGVALLALVIIGSYKTAAFIANQAIVKRDALIAKFNAFCEENKDDQLAIPAKFATFLESNKWQSNEHFTELTTTLSSIKTKHDELTAELAAVAVNDNDLVLNKVNDETRATIQAQLDAIPADIADAIEEFKTNLVSANLSKAEQKAILEALKPVTA